MEKIFIYFVVLFNVSAFSDEFRFKPATVTELTETKSFDEEVVKIGDMEITRGELFRYAGVEKNKVSCLSNEAMSIFDNSLFQTAVNTTLVATFLHTVFQAKQDKQKHALIGALIGAGAVKVCEKIFSGKDNRLVCALTGSGAALLAGIAKEAYDSNGHGNVELKDALYTFVPGALVSFKFSL